HQGQIALVPDPSVAGVAASHKSPSEIQAVSAASMPVELTIAINAHSVEISTGAQHRVELPVPTTYRGGRLIFEFADASSGELRFRLDEITAPAESELSGRWRELRETAP